MKAKMVWAKRIEVFQYGNVTLTKAFEHENFIIQAKKLEVFEPMLCMYRT